MNKGVAITGGAIAGSAIGLITGGLASERIHKNLLDRIDRLDDELENSLSDKQLTIKSKLEKRSLDLELVSKSNSEYVVLEIEVKKLKKEFLDTLRSNQIIIYNKLSSSVELYKRASKSTSVLLTLLGGLAGGILVSKLK